ISAVGTGTWAMQPARPTPRTRKRRLISEAESRDEPDLVLLELLEVHALLARAAHLEQEGQGGPEGAEGDVGVGAEEVGGALLLPVALEGGAHDAFQADGE